MLMALGVLLVLVAMWSDTAIGRSFRQSWSQRRFPRPTRGQVAVAILLIALTTALVALLKTDGVALAARAAPEAIGWFAAFDVATYLDVVALAALAALALRLRVVWSFIRSWVARCAGVVRAVRRPRSSRTPRRPRAKSRDSDEDEWRAGAAFA